MFPRFMWGRWRAVLAWCLLSFGLYVWLGSGQVVVSSETEEAMSNMTQAVSNSKWKVLSRILAQVAGQYPAATQRPSVLLLSYQRCGSSFLGQLFNQNPEAFYVFEPGDSVYTAMYGTAAGWNVPSDITHHWDGRKRAVPAEESEALAQTITQLLHCHMHQVHTEFFLHTFWHKFPDSLGRLFPFKHCVWRHRLSADTCRKPHLGDACPERFGADMARHSSCRTQLSGTRLQLNQTVTNVTVAAAFRRYHECMKSQRDGVADCIQNMEYVCTKSRLGAVKTVRATMDTVEVLLKRVPNLKVLHLIRDPRAVVRSRMTRPSFHSHYSGRDMVREARLYCEDVAQDISKRQVLETKYPDAFMEVIYEGFISQPLRQAEKVYAFLNEEPPWDVMQWLHRFTSERKNASRIAEKWQDRIPYRTTLNINKHCQNLFSLVNYPWP